MLKKIFAGMKVIRLMKNWPTYYKEFFGLIKDGVHVEYKLRNGLVLESKVFGINHRIFNEIWVYECYTPPGFEIRENDIVIDIGANYGLFSLFASRKAKNGKVFAFEPVAENYQILVNNIEKNHIKNIFPFKQAVLNKVGRRKIFLNEKCDVSHSLFQSVVRAPTRKVEIIDTIAFRSFLKQENINHIDFLKIDCEGSEYEIFYSIKNFLNKIDKISGEIHYIDEEKNVLALKKFLEKAGFIVSISPEHDTKFINLLYAKRKNLD
jgi:FkbM family methyltransferase